ncbi:MAG: transglutaminase domain-containing protein [Spirochaetales bacterium]|nr:transglutaminase domain-containing protein [Spirochaetales bacterium]
MEKRITGMGNCPGVSIRNIFPASFGKAVSGLYDLRQSGPCSFFALFRKVLSYARAPGFAALALRGGYMMMAKKIRAGVICLAAVLALASCAINVFRGEPRWSFPEQLRDAFLIPLGRRTPADAGLSVLINDVLYEENIYTDFAGGNWLVIPKSAGPARVTLTISNTAAPTASGPADTAPASVWTRHSFLIDAGDPAIRAIADQMQRQAVSRGDIAALLQTYVRDHIIHRVYPEHFGKKASETLKLSYGTCVNRARLFTALCRAAGIPARTVWGYFYVPPVGTHEGHHEWAEYLDEDGSWTALEFDGRLSRHHGITRPYVGHIDLVYAAEENPVFLSAAGHGSTVMYMSEKGDWKTARFGYRVITNNMPSRLTVEISFALR